MAAPRRNKRAALRYAFLVALVVLVVGACNVNEAPDPAVGPDRRDAGPLNATYSIDGSPFSLRNGRFEMPAAPDSAASMTLTVFGEPGYGELDGAGKADAAVILVHQGGGTGTFYYLAAAINGEGGYRGTNALLLGDRLIPRFVKIENRVIAVGFKDRGASESFASTPTIDVTRYAIMDDHNLVEVPADSEQSGWVTIGHEVREFAPCDGDTESWLLGQSPAWPDIRASYEKALSGARPYAPLFMVLSGAFMGSPQDGFGAQYDSAFFATQLIDAKPAANCREEFISIEAPLPGAVIESPLLITGRARGSWFFEGDFPVVLEDDEGNELSRSFVTAQGEWMTKDFVSFAGTLSFNSAGRGARGRLVLRKDNPTDRPELDDFTAIPVIVGSGPP